MLCFHKKIVLITNLYAWETSWHGIKTLIFKENVSRFHLAHNFPLLKHVSTDKGDILWDLQFPQHTMSIRLRNCKLRCNNIYLIFDKEHNIYILPMVIRINVMNQILYLSCVWIVGLKRSKPRLSSCSMLNVHFFICNLKKWEIAKVN